MRRLFMFVALAIATCSMQVANSFDWTTAEAGIPVGLTMGYSGCSQANSLSDQSARSRAILRAQANISKTKQLSVSGEEQIKTDQNGNSHYDMRVSESTGAYLHHVTVVNEEITNIDNVPHLCVLIVEK